MFLAIFALNRLNHRFDEIDALGFSRSASKLTATWRTVVDTFMTCRPGQYAELLRYTGQPHYP